VQPGRPTSVARTVITGGQASYRFSVGWEGVGSRGLRTLLDDRVDCLHTGSIAALAPVGPGAGGVVRAAAVARRRATVTFDPNCRPSIMGDPYATRHRAEALVAVSDVVKASEEDVRWLYPRIPVHEVMRHWLVLGAILVVVTRGRHGSWAQTPDVEVTLPARPVDVVDTIGAGDSFMAGLLASLDRAGLLGAAARPALAALDAAAVTGFLHLATGVAALTCGRTGADSPTAGELAAVIP
jgi:fructokinase